MKMRLNLAVAAASLCLAATHMRADGGGLDSAELLKPLSDSWPTYSGDYTGRRYSALTEINQANVKNLTLRWAAKLTAGPGAQGGPGQPGARNLVVGGEGTGDIVVAGQTTIKGAVLMVNGVLYVTAPDNVWALDAHDGHELWHYFWKTRGGTHIGNRGVAMWGNYLYFVTPDDYFVSIDARTGAERTSRFLRSFSAFICSRCGAIFSCTSAHLRRSGVMMTGSMTRRMSALLV